MDAAEVLEKAARRVEQGWTQGSYVMSTGEVCAVGAICYALYGDARLPYKCGFGSDLMKDKDFAKAITALDLVMEEQFGTLFTFSQELERVFYYNDFRAQKEDVIACMEKAAAGLREAGG